MPPPTILHAEPCHDTRAELGEGPGWDAERRELFWVDITGGRLTTAKLTGSGAEETGRYDTSHHIGCAVPYPGPGGGWILGADQGFAHLAGDGTVTVLAQPEAGSSVRLRMNDGCCDPAGRFWAGSMAYDNTPGAGSLFRVDLDGSVHRVLTGLTISNGLGWSLDQRTMYVTDTGGAGRPGTVDAYDYDPETGEIARRGTVISTPAGPGGPDGMTVDADGNLWVALWGHSAVHHYTPEGELTDIVELPVTQPSSCCVGGPDGRTLVITTAREGLAADQLAAQPDAGRLFSCRVAVTAPPATPFAGRLPHPGDRPVGEPARGGRGERAEKGGSR
jgi:sugar lactone lactonase YvrE